MRNTVTYSNSSGCKTRLRCKNTIYSAAGAMALTIAEEIDELKRKITLLGEWAVVLAG